MKTATSSKPLCVCLKLRCHVSGGCHSSRVVCKRIENREDARGGVTSHFQWERQCGETVTEPGETNMRHVGPQRRIFTGSNILYSWVTIFSLKPLRGIYDRSMF
ncbi:Hypothetical predicted protein [Xyrichtys novacula]|uniref:Uncharacterized protein n=1 Tax=Xyrichtys novacula TaxID=13765 RepID=A0AAV1FCG9_XYRNO|nr:Hypothetical predicted protein [Xyrichtys novacula]